MVHGDFVKVIFKLHHDNIFERNGQCIHVFFSFVNGSDSLKVASQM